MSLFAELFSLTRTRRFAMLVSSNHDNGLLTISIMPRATGEKDGAYCKDLTLTAKPEEFEADFIEAIGSYRSKVVPLLAQAVEASAAIDKSAETMKAPTTKPTTKPTPKGNGAKSQTPGTTAPPSGTSAARDYRNASSGDEGDEGDDDEPNNDWMKNRQPELF